MNQSPAKRGFSIWLIAGFLCLSCAVFAWGLQYKLSLYNTASGSNHVPEAKLVTGSDKSSVQRTVKQDAQGPSTEQYLLFLTSLLAFLSLRFAADYKVLQYRLIQEVPPVPGRLSLQHPFFFRPPPVFLQIILSLKQH
jgi:hypothetical protein